MQMVVMETKAMPRARLGRRAEGRYISRTAGVPPVFNVQVVIFTSCMLT